MAGTKSVILSTLTLTNKEMDRVNGFLESILQEGHNVVLLTSGDRSHKWSSTMIGAAFQAFDLETGQLGWISINTVAGGTAYGTEPRKFDWVLSEPKEKDPSTWWTSKVTSEEKSIHWGLSSSGLAEAIDKEKMQLTAAVVISVSSRQRCVKTRVIPGNQTAADKLHKSSFMAKKPTAKEPGFDSQTIWLGECKWATAEDVKTLKEFVSDKDFNAILGMLHK